MRGALIIWNQDKLDALEEAIDVAVAGNQRVVTWEERESTSRWATVKKHTVALEEARETANRVRCDLHQNPMPVLPENKEGREP